MLAALLKARRLEKNLSTLEVSVRTRLDPSLISRYENGNRVPTRDHVIRMANALAIEEKVLLVAWLSEKLKKVLQEEKSEEVREKAMTLVREKTDGAALMLESGNRVTESQETAIYKWKETLQAMALRNPERWKEYGQNQLAVLTCALSKLSADSWQLEDVKAFILHGKTISGHDFQSHLRLHRIFTMLENMYQQKVPLTDEQFAEYVNMLQATKLSSLPFSAVPLRLMELARVWKQAQKIPDMLESQRWLVLIMILKNQGFPLLALPDEPVPVYEEDSLLPLAEFFGEWIHGGMKDAVEFLEM
jgi:transcriptional regulator with XRE-family HTH domain